MPLSLAVQNTRAQSVAVTQALLDQAQPLALEPLQGAAVPRPMSEAVSHPSQALAQLSEHLSPALGEQAGTQPLATQLSGEVGDISTSDLLDALAPSPAPQRAYGLDEALSFRLMQYDATDQLIDQFAERLSQAMTSSTTPAQLTVLQDAFKNLLKFKQDLVPARAADHSRAKALQEQERQSAAAGPKKANEARLRAASQMLGGKLKKPFAMKKFFGLKALPTHCRAKFQMQGHQRAGKAGRPFVAGGSPLHLSAALAAHLSGILADTGLPQTSAGKLTKALGVAVGQVAERGPGWESLRRDITLKDDKGQAQVFHNELVPARLFSPAVAQAYGPERKGVSCTNNTDPDHTVNLWQTRFSSDTPDGVQFSALRHGIHDAYGLSDELRPQAADAKVREFLQAAAQAYGPRLQPVAGEPGVYALPVVSVSLVSPAKIGGEAPMLANQLQAYQRANAGDPIAVQVDLGDGQGIRQVSVRPRVVAFNVAVNSYALESKGLVRNLGSGWENSDPANATAVTALLGSLEPNRPLGGMAAQQLRKMDQQLSALQARREPGQPASVQEQALQASIGRVSALAAQVREIMRGQLHHRAGNEPYKLAARLVLLASELGLVPAFNCKSGKDRTGQLDVEVRDLIGHMALTGQLREVDHARSPSEADNLATLFQQAGGFELQRDNTGLPGSKIEVKAATQLLRSAMGRLADSEGKAGKEELAGLSKWVGS